MDVQAPDTRWPPHVGDYARVRESGTLGEVIEITCRATDSQYVLNVFVPDEVSPLVYRFEDLEPVWYDLAR